MSDHLYSQIERYRAMSPAEQALMDRLDGGELRRAVEIVERESRPRKYDPFDTSEWHAVGYGGRRVDGWRTVDDNHFAAMREYYTRGQRESIITKEAATVLLSMPPKPVKQMLMLEAGPRPFGELTERASC